MAINPYSSGLPGEEWLKRLQGGGRLVGSVPLLEATGKFTERLRAPGGAPPPPRPAASRQSLMSAISSLRPGQSVSPNPLAPRGYSDIPSVDEWGQMPHPSAARDRTDVSLKSDHIANADDDTGGGIGGYLGAPGVGNALIGAGGAMLEAAGQSGATFGGSLGTGLKNFAAERAKYAESEMARRQLAQKGQAPLQDLTARQQALMALAAMRGITDPEVLRQLMVMAGDQKSYEAALEGLEEKPKVSPTGLEEEQAILAWYLGLSEEERDAYNRMGRTPPATQTVTVEGDTPVSPANAGMDAYIQGVYDGRANTFNNVMPSLQNVEQTLDLTNHKRFDEVAGVWSGNMIADARLRFQGDPELLGMLGTFERLGSDRALDILRNFTGAKSNFEFQVSEKMAAKDRSMTPAEIRAGLELMRRAHIQEAVRWAQNMVDMGQDVQIQGEYAPVQARFIRDAQSLLDKYGEEESSWRNNSDPLGVGRGPS